MIICRSSIKDNHDFNKKEQTVRNYCEQFEFFHCYSMRVLSSNLNKF